MFQEPGIERTIGDHHTKQEDLLTGYPKTQDVDTTTMHTHTRTSHYDRALRTATHQPLHLPSELLLQILTHLSPHDEFYQPDLFSLTLVSHAWYAAAIPLLYHSPRISGRNFKSFVNTVCPSINAHVRRSALADLVRRLDMSRLVHDGSKSLTARLLGRVKGGLEVFVAPQASFAVNSLAALSKCRNLRHLDLSLISEALSLVNLFHSIAGLTRLESFFFPRCSTSVSSSEEGKIEHCWDIQWPPNLQSLHISGGLRDAAIGCFRNMPATLTEVTVENCPNLSSAFLVPLINRIRSQLRILRILYHLPRLNEWFLNGILKILPNLTELSLSTDHITTSFFIMAATLSTPHPLEMLTLESLEAVPKEKLSSDAIFIAVSEGGLSNLRRVRISARLGWMETMEGRKEMEDLRDLLEALEREQSERTGEKERETGVWIIPSTF